MAKEKSVWICNNCGADSPKWEGKCPACGQWNTLVEEKIVISPRKTLTSTKTGKSIPMKIADISGGETQRILMPSKELNRVLGGGLVPGSLVLIGGEPGIGKSTLILQNVLSIKSKRVLYVSGEESAFQLKMRADRIGRVSDQLFILCETSLESIISQIEDIKPQIIVIDSIQTIASDALESSPGSVSQVRECSAMLLKYAKTSGIPIIIIGHINKEGAIAGPKVLEHIVDAVLQFEGDRHYLYRILRSIKNRFGNTSELGIYEMCQKGLREVQNTSEMFLSQGTELLSGSAIGSALEGIRPLLIEVQALVSSAAYGTPQRAVTGFDAKRLNMLLAVLEKRVGFKLIQKDVFLNIAGGLKVSDPALDLAVISAVMSSNIDMLIPKTTCFAGEVGLSGEIRPVTRIEQRILDSEKLGMERIVIPRHNLKGFDYSKVKAEIIEVNKVEEAFRILFS